jgi:predicted lactoylglutathione lyase
MKLDAVGVVSTNLPKTISFYKILGFQFGEVTPDEKHVESVSDGSSIRLMIDTQDIIQEIIGEVPKPGNHSSFAVSYVDPQEVDAVVKNVSGAGFTVVKEP